MVQSKSGAATVAGVIREKLSDVELLGLASTAQGPVRARLTLLVGEATMGGDGLTVGVKRPVIKAKTAAVKARAAKPYAGMTAGASVLPKVKKPAVAKAGQKRSALDMHATEGAILTHIVNNPGSGAEQIGKALGFSSKEMALPIKHLVKSKQVVTTGSKRATRYTASTGATSAMRGLFVNVASHSAVAS